MTLRIPCTACGAQILIETAQKNAGLCMPCKGGYRESIEAAKRYYEQEKKEKESPARKHWVWLVNQVHKTNAGFTGLSPQNQLFFAACLLEGEVYNGGFDQYFHNSSADYYAFALQGLTDMGALESYRLSIQAKELYFGHLPVPTTQAERNAYLLATAMLDEARDTQVAEIDTNFCKDPDDFQECALNYAEKHGLHIGF